MKQKLFSQRLRRYYTWYTLCFVAFLILLGLLERAGVPRVWIGYLFIFSTIMVYAGIGIISRTADISEYYVAGRRVPALFNGMATAADWISAASFISLAGGLYLQGFEGLAYIIGWTGGFCLVGLLIAPYLRKFGQYSLADFLGTRFQNEHYPNAVRILAVIATMLISFIYVVAQIYGVGLIASRFTGVDFSVGIFLGLASILVCSFLGGMRAITWTQVAQYIVILLAYMIPVVWLSVKHTNDPFPAFAYGQTLSALSAQEEKINHDPKELQVRALYRQRADEFALKITQLPGSWIKGREDLQARLTQLLGSNASLIEIRAAQIALEQYPKVADEARQKWQAARNSNLARSLPVTAHTEPFPGQTLEESNIKRNNFLALVFCLMLGTAAMPHVLIRYYTTPSVAEARTSVFWSLFFIMLIYITIPALAVLVKVDIYSSLVGSEYARLPEWVSYWASVDKVTPLISIQDLNHDGIVQLSEIMIDGDMVVLATPEIAGLPYVISGLIAAGGLAAALSTADGLLLAMSNSLSHDIYYKILAPQASTHQRVTSSKLVLLVMALVAAWVASLKPAGILSIVVAAFSLACSSLFPALVLGVFWKRANVQGAIAGMTGGFGICALYMLQTLPGFGGNEAHLWFHIAPISAGVFGVPAGLLAMIAVSLSTARPDQTSATLVDHIREG